MIKIVFFAALREQLGCSELSLDPTNILTINQLKQALIEHQPQWQTFIENNALLSAINHDMVDGEHLIKSGDEIAFFPPVTGG
ncbi:MAG: molybdopterin converting factor subunit 1 [Colwellia sp.]|nr:molybdopterin converting factor subunit 1 [Colwellia sp.]